jgi:hypothetical protein
MSTITYNGHRPHRALGQAPPLEPSEPIVLAPPGRVVRRDRLGGLIHEPEGYGLWQTCYERFGRWQADGTWQRLLTHAQIKFDAVGAVDWDVVVDATIVRVHQHAAGAERGPAAT